MTVVTSKPQVAERRRRYQLTQLESLQVHEWSPSAKRNQLSQFQTELPQGTKELIVTLIGGNERRPNASERRRFPSEIRSAQKKIIVAVVRPHSLPFAVSQSIG